MTDWKADVLRMRFDESRTWGYIIEHMQDRFPGKNASQIRDIIRDVVRRDPRYKTGEAPKDEPKPGKTFIPKSRWKDGVYERERLIEMNDEDDKSPRRMLELHGLNPDEWDVIECVNEYWNAQVHHTQVAVRGPKLEMRLSKMRAKPKCKAVTFEDVKRFFDETELTTAKPPVIPMRFDPDGETLEIDIADLHSGLYAWGAETGENYDVNIARERFFNAIRDILARCDGRKFKRIILALLGDLLHTDNDAQTTTKGTFQQVDGRMPRVFTKTLEMLIEAIDWLGAIAPVDVVYTRGNHDSTTGWMLIKSVEQAYRNDPNVTVDVSPDPQKHRLIGNALIGFVHGDMPPKNLAGWLQVRARQMGKPIRFMEVHSGDKHALKTRERVQTEDLEGVIIRTMPTICTSSTWEHHEGYDGATRTVVSFVWHDESGLREMWYSNM